MCNEESEKVFCLHPILGQLFLYTLQNWDIFSKPKKVIWLLIKKIYRWCHTITTSSIGEMIVYKDTETIEYVKKQVIFKKNTNFMGK